MKALWLFLFLNTPFSYIFNLGAMKFLKRLLFVLLAIIALALIVALFVKKEFSISREIVINKPVSEVFGYVRYIKNQDHYSVWNQLDPSMKKMFTGTDGTPGFIYAWDGNKNAGKGAQEIKNIIENQKIDIELRFEEPMQVTNMTTISTEAVATDKTKVTWSMYGTSAYPFNLLNLCMDAMVGKDLQKNLENLKAVLEK